MIKRAFFTAFALIPLASGCGVLEVVDDAVVDSAKTAALAAVDGVIDQAVDEVLGQMLDAFPNADDFLPSAAD